MNKKDLRQSLRRKISYLNEQQKLEKSQMLSDHLASLLEEINSENGFAKLGVFTPMSDEPLWSQNLLGFSRWDLAVVHMGEELSFHPITSESYERLGVCLELPESLKGIQVQPEVVLVPGLGFSRNLERIGRGKGYYDRFLSSFKGVSIGVFFSESEVEDVLAQEHDEKLNFIVTDKEIIRRPNK